VYPSIVARQRLGRHVPAATNTHNNRIIARTVVFYTVRVVSKESLWVCLCIPLSLLDNGSINTFPRQRKIVGGVIFYAVRVVSKESRRLVLTKVLVAFQIQKIKCHCFRNLDYFCMKSMSILHAITA
jgi:hypothetical protein